MRPYALRLAALPDATNSPSASHGRMFPWPLRPGMTPISQSARLSVVDGHVGLSRMRFTRK